MSAIDDIRKLLQDLVTPDLKALEAKVEALDKKVDALDKKVDLQSTTLSYKIDLNRDLLLAEIRAMKASVEVSIVKLAHSLDIDKRLSKIESERAPQARKEALEKVV